jgi:hypothetical protein
MSRIDIKKFQHMLISISRDASEKEIVEILQHSDFIASYQSGTNWLILTLKVLPDIFSKHAIYILQYTNVLEERIRYTLNIPLDKLKITPDYDKLEIVDTRIQIIYTKWDEINQIQGKLFDLLKAGFDHIDFQNIGNTARTIMLKLAEYVFDPKKHIPDISDIDLSVGKFKNQLHTYIDSILAGESNREFRVLAESSIDFVENSIDLMNKITHKPNAKKHLAEVCVISTISAVSIVKLINELE